MSSPHKDWQQRCARQYANANKRDFLIVATPGAGKTRAALDIANRRIDTGLASKLVVIVPSVRLKYQWAQEASKQGLQLDPEWSNENFRFPRGMRGIVATYAQVAVGAGPQIFRAQTDSETFVIFDEIHHCGAQLSWGVALRTAFENVGYRLSLSGTPFRGDNERIPFITYERERTGTADFEYTYGDALRDGVCRDVYFPRKGGRAEWWDGIIRSASFEDEIADAEQSRRLNTILTTGPWLSEVVAEADTALTELRETDPDAAGLVIARDQDHARRIAQMMRTELRLEPVLATSDEPGSAEAIERFTRSGDRWIVAVKMVSEGVDIPRLRVGVYATNVADSELFFRQVVGRFVRVESTNENDHAVLFLPDDQRLIAFAEQIKDQRVHELAEEIDRATRLDLPEERQLATWLPIDSSGAENAGSIGFDSQHFTAAELAEAEKFRLLSRSYAKLPAVLVAQLLRDARRHSTETPMAAEREPEPEYVRRRRLRQMNDRLAKSIAMRQGIEFKTVNATLNRAIGIKSVKDATTPQLQERARVASGWLDSGELRDAV